MTEEEQWKEAANKENKILFMAMKVGDIESLEHILKEELTLEKKQRKMVSSFLQLIFTRMERNEKVNRGVS